LTEDDEELGGFATSFSVNVVLVLVIFFNSFCFFLISNSFEASIVKLSLYKEASLGGSLSAKKFLRFFLFNLR